MEHAIQKLKKNHKYVGIATGSAKKEVVDHWHDLGADMLCAGADFSFVTDGAKELLRIFQNQHIGE